MSNCIRCGFPLQEGDQFCKRCGATTGVTPVPPKRNEQSSQNQFMPPEQGIGETRENSATSINNDFNDFGKSTVTIEKKPEVEENVTQNSPEQPEGKSPKKKPSKNKNQKILILIVGILVVVLIGIIIFALMTVIANDDEEAEDEVSEATSTKNESKNETEKNTTSKNTTKNTTNTTGGNSNVASGDEIVIAGYEFEIPEGLIGDVLEYYGIDYLVLGDSVGDWSAEISISEELTYDDLLGMYDELEDIFADVLLVEVENKENIKIGNANVIKFEIESYGEKQTTIFLEAEDGGKTFEIDIYTDADASIDDETLEKIVNSVSNAKYTGEDTTYTTDEDDEGDLKANNGIDFSKIKE